MVEFSVIIPTHQRPASLLQAVRSWLAVDAPPGTFEIVVVDDENREAARRALHDLTNNTRVSIQIVNGTRSGPAAARNLGVLHTRGRVLIFSDDDMTVRPDHFLQQSRTREICGSDCLVSAAWDYPLALRKTLARSSFGRLLLNRAQSQRLSNQSYLAAACWEYAVADTKNLSVDREIFEMLDGFDDTFLLPGVEDCELGLRARKEGFRLIKNYDLRTENHDSVITLRRACEQEERYATGYLTLAQKMPNEFGEIPYLVQNGPILPSDPIALKLKKLARLTLSGTAPLAFFTCIAELGDRLGAWDSVLHPYFERVIGLHTVRVIACQGGARYPRPSTSATVTC